MKKGERLWGEEMKEEQRVTGWGEVPNSVTQLPKVLSHQSSPT